MTIQTSERTDPVRRRRDTCLLHRQNPRCWLVERNALRPYHEGYTHALRLLHKQHISSDLIPSHLYFTLPIRPNRYPSRSEKKRKKEKAFVQSLHPLVHAQAQSMPLTHPLPRPPPSHAPSHSVRNHISHPLPFPPLPFPPYASDITLQQLPKQQGLEHTHPPPPHPIQTRT